MNEQVQTTNETDRLRSITGQHKWINHHDENRIEKSSPSSMNLFDVQIQVENGHLEPIVRYEVFPQENLQPTILAKENRICQTNELTDAGDGHKNNSSNNRNDSSRSNENRRDRSDKSSDRSAPFRGDSSFSPGDGSDPRRPRDNNDELSESDDEEETDEAFARRMSFRPIDNETIRVVGRIRSLTKRTNFDHYRDFEILQNSIDDLIRLQRLELFTEQHLTNIVRSLKIHRAFRSEVQALSFVQSRLPAREVHRTQQENAASVFDLWRQRERRARADSKDSLEEENQQNEVHSETNSSSASKVKKMARDIDTKTVFTTSHNVQQVVHDSLPTTIPIETSNDQNRVREIIDRLESSSSTGDNQKRNFRRKFSIEDKIDDFHPEQISKAVRKEIVEEKIVTNNGKTDDNDDDDDDEEETYFFHHQGPNEEIIIRQRNPSATARLQLEPNEFRTASGQTVDELINSLLPSSQTTLSMVRDVRTRFYDEDSNQSQVFNENLPMKVDVETLYILEQRETRKPTIDFVRPSINDRQDFASQTLISNSTVKPENRPVGTQVETTIDQQTVSAQTSDSLHWPTRERQSLSNLINVENDEDTNQVTTTTITRRYEVKRRHSSHYSSEDEANEEPTKITIEIDEKNNETLPTVPNQTSSFGHVSSKIRMDQLRQLNRQIVERHTEQQNENLFENQPRSNEVYEIHTRGACKCLVVTVEEKPQTGSETRLENQLRRIEQTYNDDELQRTEIHVIVTNSDRDYQLVRRDYGTNQRNNEQDARKRPAINIHYYDRSGQRMSTEYHRFLDHLPLFIRCEIDYELNHYRTAKIIVLSVTAQDRRQTTFNLKKEIVDEIISHSAGRYTSKSPELENEIQRQLSKSISIFHLVDYSSRDGYSHTNSTDTRRVSRLDVMTSLRLVQRHRTIVHRLCQLYRSHLHLTAQEEKQRHLILVCRDENYLLDLASTTTEFTTTQVVQEKRPEIHNVPFDYAKYRRETKEQQRFLEQYRRQQQQRQQTQIRQAHQGVPPAPGDPNEAEFYLGSGRRAMIEKEIHSMRGSIRPHERAPPVYKHEPRRRTLSVGCSGGQRYVRARIIHVKDYFDENQPRQQYDHKNAKEQELFVRVDDFINEGAANSLRRSYSKDYLVEDGPRSRIRYIRIPGETIRIEEKNTYEFQGVMYTNLPYSLRYWNILQLLDRDARQGRPLGENLPHVIVNDPYKTVIPPLTQQDIQQTAQTILSPNYNIQTTTDQTLRWFLSRDNRTEIESSKYLQNLAQYQRQKQMQQQQLQKQLEQQKQASKRTEFHVEGGQQRGTKKKIMVTETLVRYEKMPDRLVPVNIPDRSKSTENLHQQHRITQSQQSNGQRRATNQSLSIFQPTKTNVQTAPLSRHRSVHELYFPHNVSHPPSPSPSLHSLHNQRQQRPSNSGHLRQSTRGHSQSQNPLLTEIIDSQTGRRILTTSQEQLPREVLGLLNRYNLQNF